MHPCRLVLLRHDINLSLAPCLVERGARLVTTWFPASRGRKRRSREASCRAGSARPRVEPSSVLLKHDQESGVEALNDLVRSWPETETFRQAAELLGQADRTLAEVSLTVVAEDVNAPIQQRFTAASHLVSRLDAEPDLLLSLVMSRDIERESSRPTRALIVESGRSPPIPWLGSVGKHPGGLISDACVRCRHGDVAGQLIHGDGCFGLAQATPSVREHLTATRERGATQRADRRSGDPSRAVDCRRRRTVVLPWKPLR